MIKRLLLLSTLVLTACTSYISPSTEAVLNACRDLADLNYRAVYENLPLQKQRQILGIGYGVKPYCDGSIRNYNPRIVRIVEEAVERVRQIVEHPG